MHSTTHALPITITKLGEVRVWQMFHCRCANATRVLLSKSNEWIEAGEHEKTKPNNTHPHTLNGWNNSRSHPTANIVCGVGSAHNRATKLYSGPRQSTQLLSSSSTWENFSWKFVIPMPHLFKFMGFTLLRICMGLEFGHPKSIPSYLPIALIRWWVDQVNSRGQ